MASGPCVRTAMFVLFARLQERGGSAGRAAYTCDSHAGQRPNLAKSPRARRRCPIGSIKARALTSLVAERNFSLIILIYVKDMREAFKMRLERVAAPLTAFDAVLETALDAVVAMDVNGIVTGWNKVAEEIFGWRESEAVGLKLSELIIPAEQRAAHEAGLRRYSNTGKARVIAKRLEMTALRKSGEEFPVELSIVLSPQGASPLFIGFLRDLSSQKAAQEEVCRLQAEVLHLSRLGAMGSMAAMLAHELNQPLAAAYNYLAAAQRLSSNADVPPPAELDFPLTQAKAAVLRASDTIRMIRDMTARKHASYAEHDLYEAIHAALALLRPSMKIKAQVFVASEASSFWGSRVQLEHVLINLIKNAAEALDEVPQPRLSIRCISDEQQIEVRVEDNGRGISEPLRERLFTPFSTSKDGGTGLGLSICRSIVEQHGGRIWAEDLSPGTAFCFTIPRRKAPPTLGSADAA